MRSRIVVIGGGLVGSSAAYRVACQGAEAILVDRRDQGQATAAGAGILSPGSGFQDADADLLALVRAELRRRRAQGFSHVGEQARPARPPPFAVARFRQGFTSSRGNRGGSRPAPPR